MEPGVACCMGALEVDYNNDKDVFFVCLLCPIAGPPLQQASSFYSRPVPAGLCDKMIAFYRIDLVVPSFTGLPPRRRPP